MFNETYFGTLKYKIDVSRKIILSYVVFASRWRYEYRQNSKMEKGSKGFLG